MGNRWAIGVSLLLTGCIAVPKGDLPEVREWPPRANSARRKPSVSLSLRFESFFNGQKEVAGPESPELLQVGMQVFEDSALFSGVHRSNIPADLEVEMEWLSKCSGSKFLAALCFCSLGAVPLILQAEVETRATFKSRSGNQLGAVEMGERVTEFGWTPILPVALFSSPQRVYTELQVNVYRATLVEALRRGYLDP